MRRVGAFLSFLADDMARNPQGLVALDAALLERVRGLTAGTEVDLNAALDESGE